jgi:hypothetical protein
VFAFSALGEKITFAFSTFSWSKKFIKVYFPKSLIAHFQNWTLSSSNW